MTERLAVHSIIWVTFSDSRVYTGHTHMHTFAAATVLQLYYKTGEALQVNTILLYIYDNVAQFILKQQYNTSFCTITISPL